MYLCRLPTAARRDVTPAARARPHSVGGPAMLDHRASRPPSPRARVTFAIPEVPGAIDTAVRASSEVLDVESEDEPTVGGSPVRWRERVVKPRPKAGQPQQVVKTYYWQPDALGLQRIACPPDLKSQPQLALGDVFYYPMLTRYQLWLWTSDDSGRLYWLAVRYGYRREDGRRLIITPELRKPSWVTESRWAQLGHGEYFIRRPECH